jgi:hypothetical protein
MKAHPGAIEAPPEPLRLNMENGTHTGTMEAHPVGLCGKKLPPAHTVLCTVVSAFLLDYRGFSDTEL